MSSRTTGMPKIEQERAVPTVPTPGRSRLAPADGMIPGLNLYPTYSPALPCETLECRWRHFAIGVCREGSCPHAWDRAGAEDRARREEKDRKMAVDGRFASGNAARGGIERTKQITRR